MPTNTSQLQHWRYSSKVRVTVATICGIVVALVTSGSASLLLGWMWGWDVAAAVYSIWLFATVFQLNCVETSRLASAEDPDRFTVDVLMVLAGLVSLVAVGMALIASGNAHGAAKTILMTTCVASVVLSWLLVHMTFTLRYASLFYEEPKGGVDFHGEEDPSFVDFAYMSFTVGMTYQVSDTSVRNTKIRRAILGHSLLSFLFGTVIVATTINLVAGLSK